LRVNTGATRVIAWFGWRKISRARGGWFELAIGAAFHRRNVPFHSGTSGRSDGPRVSGDRDGLGTGLGRRVQEMPFGATLHNGHYQTFLRASLGGRAGSGPGPIQPIQTAMKFASAPALCLLLLSSALQLQACRSSTTDSSAAPGALARSLRAELEMPVAAPPYDHVQANWKERLDQRYACLEIRGSYTQTARALKDVLEAVRCAGLEPSGAPFALFYDDPGHTDVAALRSRACVPIEGDGAIAAPYQIDVLPSATVVYAFVGGPYGDVPRAYPGVFAYADHMGWKECGPIREVYLVPPGSVSDWNDLICEVQVPAQPAR
jgi:effector-binding domain-containing protein